MGSWTGLDTPCTNFFKTPVPSARLYNHCESYRMPKCIYCSQEFQESYDLFQHMNTHDVQWVQWVVQREERFVIVDTIPDIREERFIINDRTPPQTPTPVYGRAQWPSFPSWTVQPLSCWTIRTPPMANRAYNPPGTCGASKNDGYPSTSPWCAASNGYACASSSTPYCPHPPTQTKLQGASSTPRNPPPAKTPRSTCAVSPPSQTGRTTPSRSPHQTTPSTGDTNPRSNSYRAWAFSVHPPPYIPKSFTTIDKSWI